MKHTENHVLEKEYARLVEKMNYNRTNTNQLTDTEKARYKRLEKLKKINHSKNAA